MSVELAIVVPTFNERDNVAPLHAALSRTLSGRAWEVIFVDDDSPDRTAVVIQALAQRDPRVRCLQRIGRRGLSSACIEGVLATAAPYVCIMDADLQHDESIIPRMFDLARSEGLDLVVATRYAGAGSTGTLSPLRVQLSRLATRAARTVTRVPVTDPMSGFFLFRRDWFTRTAGRLSARGFKILLDMLLSSPHPPRYAEVAYSMRSRVHGESKLSISVGWDFLLLLAHKLSGRAIPVRFISFTAVGLSGVAVHMAVLGTLHRLLGIAFLFAQMAATITAMTSNFFLNNRLTWPERRLRGVAVFRGLAGFYLACAFGALINVALADWLASRGFPWWGAGMIGIIAGAVWNYGSSGVLIWRDAGR